MTNAQAQGDFELVELSEGRLVVRAVAPCSAQALAVAAGMSRASAARAFAAGLACAPGSAAPLSGGARLAPGDEVAFALEPTDAAAAVVAPAAATSVVASAAAAVPAPTAPADGVAILYEDPVLLVADKPAGLLVHGDGTGAATLTDLVRAHLSREGLAGPAHVAQAVQRLDVDTTGAVVFSKTEQLQPALDALVAEHDAAGAGMRKRYLAVVRGDFPTGERTCELGVARDRHDARRMRAVPLRAGAPGGAKAARTTLVLLGRREGRSLVMAELGTGRRHQIRVHLAALGFPIVGDPLYGPPARGQRGSRGGRADRPDGTGALMLHAWETSFVHPVTGERVTVRAPLPPSFAALGFGEPSPRAGESDGDAATFGK